MFSEIGGASGQKVIANALKRVASLSTMFAKRTGAYIRQKVSAVIFSGSPVSQTCNCQRFS